MANQSYEYNIDFWSRTNSNTFICNSKFHASHKAIIMQLTTTTVTFYDIQIWKHGTMSTNVRDYIFNFSFNIRYYYNCRFNARSYFEWALVLLDNNVGK